MMAQKKMNKEDKLKKELRSWKETAEILSDQKIMRSIDKSLKEIAAGKGIPISQL
jgi:PHD/YefM family antitoxin component YafN of YafNO toxin-antitoxin module